MLHSEGRQGGQENHIALIASRVFLAAFVTFCLLLTSCDEAPVTVRQNLTKELLSKWQQEEYALNIRELDECLEQFVSKDHDTTVYDAATRRYYRDQQPLLWATRRGVDAKADSVLAYLEQAVPAHGLSAKAFQLSQIREDLDKAKSLDTTSQRLLPLMARLEYRLTKAFLRYTGGQRYGFADPRRVYNRLTPRTTDSLGHVKNYVRLFDAPVDHCPKHYADSIATLFRQLDPSEVSTFLHEQEPDDKTYETLRLQLPSATTAEARTRILVNMERLRWRMPHKPSTDKRSVLVNLAARQLWATCPDSSINMRIVCGATKSKTPMLASFINLLQINPEWNIPMSIIRNDIAHHAGNPGYFARHRYYIANRSTGQRVSAANVTAGQLLSGAYRVAQESGAGNSLGRLIFRFPNNFDVYLHDTSNRGAFQGDLRLLSHGCVRLEKPFELTRFVLAGVDDWTLDKIRLSIDLPPETDRGKEMIKNREEGSKGLRLINSHYINPTMPVYLLYYTEYPNPITGQLQIWPDVYGYDAPLERAIKPFI